MHSSANLGDMHSSKPVVTNLRAVANNEITEFFVMVHPSLTKKLHKFFF